MNQGNKAAGAGRMIAGCLLGIALALFAPLTIITELMSLMTVILVPAVALVLLHRWSGLGSAILSAALMLVFTARLLGGTFMWMTFLTTILPLLFLLRSGNQPFFTRMKIAIAAFCGGTVASVALMYFTYGGNMIERIMMLLPQAMHTLPAEALQLPMETLAAALGREMTLESFYILFEDAIANLIPYYQLNLPGLLFSGAILTAVLCAALDGCMCVRRGLIPPERSIPLRDWYLPASTTSGLLTMAIAAYAIHLLGMQQGQTLYTTVYSIALTVFSIQAMASFARRLHETRIRPGVQTGILVVIAVLSLMGGALYTGLYGLASAILGRRGSLRQKIEEKQNNHSDQP